MELQKPTTEKREKYISYSILTASTTQRSYNSESIKAYPVSAVGELLSQRFTRFFGGYRLYDRGSRSPDRHYPHHHHPPPEKVGLSKLMVKKSTKK